MIYPSEKEFIRLSKKGNLIPVYTEILADTETPVSAYLKIKDKYSFLFESVEGGENIARFSFLGASPTLVFISKKDRIELVRSGKKVNISGKPIKELAKLLSFYKPVKNHKLPRFQGGFVGYLGYDNIRFLENIPDKNIDTLKLPDALFMLADTVLAFDHVKHKIIIIANALVGSSPKAAYHEAVKKIKALQNKLNKKLAVAPIKLGAGAVPADLTSNMGRPDFMAAIKKAKEHIKVGDIIQVVLSRRFETKTGSAPFDVYRKLRMINPSPYMFYMALDKFNLVGSSPEVMVRLEDNTATLRPIAGTRPRGKTAEQDRKLEKNLLDSKKEKAEHLMLVDLGRNDLGRVCMPGSVKVDDFMAVEKYSHVMHIVSNVIGRLRKNKNAFDLLAACFPAGTVSGAPKVRAMEIIDELENVSRGPYAGAVGYFSFSGDLDTCIAIRTIIMKGQKAYIQAGAGIVADSDPVSEAAEVENKAKALFLAIK